MPPKVIGDSVTVEQQQQRAIMKDLQKRSKLMAMERRCTDGVEHLRTALEAQLHSGISHTDLWDKTISFFALKKTPVFHDGYSKYSRDTLRLFHAPDEDLVPLCFQN